MSNTIDQRILEMQFDNQQFEKNVGTTIKSLKDLKEGLKLDDSTKSVEKLKKATDDVNLKDLSKNVDFIASKFTAFGILGVRVMERISDAVINTGKRLVKSLSIDQVTAGWTKYEQKTASVQTIMNATGKSIDEVNKYLDKLMWFSDETSFGFTDMTAAISQMTSAGGDIGKLVPLVTGVANATAYAGKGAGEFARAMYNLNQSYSAGALQYMDWKSLELAGIASEQLKQTFIDTGIEMKKIKKGEVTVGNFGQTLSKRWADQSVMEAAFGKFGAMTEKAYEMVMSGEVETAAQAYAILSSQFDEVYSNAAKAAQEAKSFTEAIDATKDAVSSGWMRTFELIFGNYKEATILWTDLTEALWEVFASGSIVRNELLAEWKELGGRADLIQGITDILGSLWSVVVRVKEAFHDIFPETTVDNLLAISSGVKKFGDNLKKVLWYKERLTGTTLSETVIGGETPDFLGELKKGMKGDQVKELQKMLQEAGEDVGKAGVDGIFGPATEAALKRYQEKNGLTADGVLTEAAHTLLFGGGEKTKWVATDNYVNEYSKTLETLGRIARGLFAVFSIAGKAISFVFNVVGHVVNLLAPLGEALLLIGAYIGDALVAFNDWLESSGIFSDWLDSVVDFLAPLGEEIKSWADAILRFFGFGDAAKEAVDSLMTFPKIWNSIKESVAELKIWEKLTNAFQKLKKSLEPLRKLFKKYYDSAKAYLGEKFNSFLAKATEKIPVIIGKVTDAIVWLVDKVSPYVAKIPEILSKIKNFFVGIWESLGITDKLTAAWGTVRDFFKNMWSSLFGRTGNKGKGTDSIFTKIGAFFGRIWKTISESELLQKAWDKVKSFFSSFWKFLVGSEDPDTGEAQIGFLYKVRDFFVELWTTVKESERLRTAWESVKNFFIGIWEGIVSFFSKPEENGELEEAEKNMTVLEKVVDTFGRGWERITSVFKGAFAGADKLLNAIGSGGLLWIFSAIIGLRYIVKFVSAVKGIMFGITQFGQLFKLDMIKPKKVQSLGLTILQFALAIGTIMGAIYLLGSMEPDQLKQGALALVGVLAVLAIVVGAVFALRKTDISSQMEKMGKGLFLLGAAIGIIAASIYVMGKMKPDQLVRGVLALAGILFVLYIFMVAVKGLKTTKMSFSGLWDVAAAVGILAVVAWLIGGIDQKKFWTGFVRMGAIMALMLVFLALLNKVGKGAAQIKISGIFMLALAIGALGLISRMLGGMNTDLFWTGFWRMSAIMAALFIFITAVNKIGGGKLKIGGLLMMAAAMVVLAGIVVLLGTLPTKMIVKGIGGLIGIVVAMRIFSKAVGRVDIKKGVGALIAIVGLSAVMIAFAHSINKVKNVDEKKILAFSSGLAAIFTAFGIFAKLSSGAGFGGILSSMGMLIGLIIAIGAVIAAFSLLTQIPGFQEFMERGVASIGKMVGTFFGSMRASELTSFAEGVSGIGEISVDTKGVKSAIEAATLLNEFAQTLPNRVWWKQILDWVAGSDLQAFSRGMADFGTGFNTFATQLGEVSPITEDLSENTTAAIEIATQISTFSAGLSDTDTPDWVTVASFITGSTVLGQFSRDMGSFGRNLKEFVAGITGIEYPEGETHESVSKKTQDVVAMAEVIRDFSLGLNQLSWAEALSGRTSLTLFNKGMAGFGSAFGAYATEMSKIEIPKGFDLDKATNDAIKIAESISEFASANLPDVGFVGLLFNRSDFTVFNKGLIGFGKAFSGYVSELGDIELGDLEKGGVLEEKTDGALRIATSISQFAKVDLPDTSFTEKLFRSNLEVFADGIYPLGAALTGFAREIMKVRYDAKIEAQANHAVAIAETISGFTKNIEKVGFIDALLGWTAWKNRAKIKAHLAGFDIFIETMVEIGQKLKGAPLPDMLAIDNPVDNAIKMAGAFTGFSENVPEIGMLDALLGWSKKKNKEKVDAIAAGMIAFAEGINGFALALGETPFPEDFPTKTQTAVDAASTLSTFLVDLQDPASDIEKDKGVLEKFFTGETLTDTVLGRIKTLGETIAEIAVAFGGVGEGFDTKAETVKTALMALANFMSWASKQNDSIDEYDISEFSKTLSDLAYGLERFTMRSDGVDVDSLYTISVSVGHFVNALATLMRLKVDNTNPATALVDAFKEFEKLSESFEVLLALDGDAIGAKLTELATAVNTATSVDFSSTGTGLVEALSANINVSSLDTSGMKAIGGSLVSIAKSYTDDFLVVGKDMMTGLAGGVKNNAKLALEAVKQVARSMVTEARKEIRSSSPSREFMDIGMDADMGLVLGLRGFSKIVQNEAAGVGSAALAATRKSLSNLSSIIDSDMDVDPVIRPVVDLSNVNYGAKTIDGIFSNRGTVAIGSVRTKELANCISATQAAKKNQNGSGSGVINAPSSAPIDSSSVISGNNFYIRSERDIYALASELASIKNQQQRGMGGS